MMIAYASRIGTGRDLDALRAAVWRLVVSARGVYRTEGYLYALDNGAWSSFRVANPCMQPRSRGWLAGRVTL